VPLCPRERESARKIAHAHAFARLFSRAATLKCLFFKCFALVMARGPLDGVFRTRIKRRLEPSRRARGCCHSRCDVNAKSVFLNSVRGSRAPRVAREGPGISAKKRHSTRIVRKKSRARRLALGLHSVSSTAAEHSGERRARKRARQLRAPSDPCRGSFHHVSGLSMSAVRPAPVPELE
jgi:hypothetical protein